MLLLAGENRRGDIDEHHSLRGELGKQTEPREWIFFSRTKESFCLPYECDLLLFICVLGMRRKAECATQVTWGFQRSNSTLYKKAKGSLRKEGSSPREPCEHLTVGRDMGS